MSPILNRVGYRAKWLCESLDIITFLRIVCIFFDVIILCKFSNVMTILHKTPWDDLDLLFVAPPPPMVMKSLWVKKKCVVHHRNKL